MDLLPAAVFTVASAPPATQGERALHKPVSVPGAAGVPGTAAGSLVVQLPSALSPETLHPALWRAHQLGRQACNAVPSGFAVLDAQLPGGGWPRRVLTELLLSHPGVGEVRLLAPSLAAIQRAGRLVMLFDPPAALSAWALAQLGFDVDQLLVIDTRAKLTSGCDSRQPEAAALESRKAREAAALEGGRAQEAAMREGRRAQPAAALEGRRSQEAATLEGRRAQETAALEGRLWALEQALKSGHVGALVAWLPPRLRGERLRRLQLAAQAHDGPAFVLREMAAQQRPSAAPLRLALRPGGADVLAVHLLKRRGPPLEAQLYLALPVVLSGVARQRAAAGVHNGAPQRAPEAAGLPAATFVNLA